MAESRGPASGAGRGSGTAGGADVEPLRGGMREQERGEVGPEHERAGRDAPELPGRARSEEGAVHRRDGNVRRGDAPVPPGSPGAGDTRRDPEDKVVEERGDHENEAGNAPGYGGSPRPEDDR